MRERGACFIGCLLWLLIIIGIFAVAYAALGAAGVILLLALLGFISLVASLLKKAR